MRLKARLAVSLMAVLALLILLAAWLSWLDVREAIRAGVIKQLDTLVSYAAQGMDNDLRLAIGTTRAVGVGAPALAHGEELSRYMASLPMPMGALERCLAIAPDGQLLAQKPTDPPLGREHFADREYFRRLMQTRQPVISKPFAGPITGKPFVVIAVPRLDGQGAVDLVMQCTLSLLSESLFEEVRSTRLGRSGNLFVATRGGMIVLHPQAARILSSPLPSGVNPLIDKARQGFNGTEEVISRAGVRALMGAHQLQLTDWYVGSYYPLAEADAPLAEARQRVALITLAAMLVSGVLAWFLAGLMVRPLERLTRRVRHLREHPQVIERLLPARNDEIGELAQSFSGLLDTLAEREARLRASEEKFSKAFYSNPGYASITRFADGGLVAVNQGFERMMGWRAEEVLGRTVIDIGLWADIADRQRMQSQLRQDGEWHGRVRFQRKDGAVLLVEGACVLFELGGEQQVLGTARDITEVERAEAARRQSEEKFSKVFHASPDGILVVSLAEGIILDINESTEKLLGYSRQEMVGHTTVELNLWSDPAHREEFRTRLKAKGVLPGFESSLRRRDGSVVDVLASTVIVDLAGIPCLISLIRDVTEQRRIEEEIRNINVALDHRVRERTAALEAALRELETFSYSVSHDLRSPLRAIAGFAQMIDEDFAGQLGKAGRDQLGRIIANAIRMGELIDDMLDFARIGRAELKAKPLDMTGLAREVLAELPEAGSGRRIDIRIDELPKALADRSLIRQVWANLLSNAVKYTRRCEVAVIEIGGKVEGDEAHYWVRDNGAGFDMQYADKLFRVFQRLHRDPDFEGTGIGLATVARIVQRHGGHVRAEAEPGKGATFHFTLPASDAAAG